ncbi:MAG: trehalose-6-phosphate synthase [Elusimicrobia bacterium]|nr:trehalose-6-phosphate synthase [Elusimicrobiota bacterium]
MAVRGNDRRFEGYYSSRRQEEGFEMITVVSNREPYRIKGKILSRNIGGLVSAFEPLLRKEGGNWVAHGVGLKKNQIIRLNAENGKFVVHRLALRRDEFGGYYYGFSNRVMWPLCHQFIEKCSFIIEYWNYYRKVNRKFADYILKISDEKPVWVQDFHLTLVPKFIRRKKPHQKILFFWHIPWPTPMIFSTLPWRKEVLEGLLSSDLLAFHTRGYVDNFKETVKRIFPESAIGEDMVFHKSHRTHLKAIPIGIDYKNYRNVAQSKMVEKNVEKFRRQFRNCKIIIGVDRLDYTKGILRRLWAIENFFDRYPQWKGKVSFVQIATPSRENVTEYNNLKREIDRTIGRLEGKFATLSWNPIYYFYRRYTTQQLVSFYRLADVALLTPLYDGWNMVASEFVASQIDENGVLILSEFAGCSSFFKEALICNPYDTKGVADAINRALKMPRREKTRRLREMTKKIAEHTVFTWLVKNLQEIEKV